MGGLSKWNILRDDGMSDRVPQVFGPVPEVLAGVLPEEAQRVWRDWNLLAWEMIRLRGLLIDPSAESRDAQLYPAQPLVADGPFADFSDL